MTGKPNRPFPYDHLRILGIRKVRPFIPPERKGQGPVSPTDIDAATDRAVHKIRDILSRADMIRLDGGQELRMALVLCKACYYTREKTTGDGGARCRSCAEYEGPDAASILCTTCAKKQGICRRCCAKLTV